jgi:hypothetical protein
MLEITEPNEALHLTPAASRLGGVYDFLAAGAGELLRSSCWQAMSDRVDPDRDALEWYRFEDYYRMGRGVGSIRLARTSGGTLEAFWGVALGCPVAVAFRSGAVQMPKSDWDRMLQLIAEAAFWTLPEQILPQDRGLDGPFYEFTGWLPERRHHIWRYRPTEQDGERVVHLVRFMQQLFMAYTR